jgi:Family of unknown function (DUF6882)
MNTMTYADILKQSREYLLSQQDIIKQKYGLDDYLQMDFEQETGKMIFTLQGGKKVGMSYCIVGSISDRSNTWMWSWDNPYLLDNVTDDMLIVRSFGEKNGLEKLTSPKWPGNDDDGWEMTAIAAWVLKAKGAFSFLSDEMMVFVVFRDISWL